jgi:hypothetical protein
MKASMSPRSNAASRPPPTAATALATAEPSETHAPVDLSPAQRTQLLPAGADEQREHDVGVEPEALGRGEQRLGPGFDAPPS